MQILPQASVPRHTAGEDLNPAVSTRRFFLLLWLARQAVDPGLQADLVAESPTEPAEQIWRPTADRTFVEGPEGHCS